MERHWLVLFILVAIRLALAQKDPLPEKEILGKKNFQLRMKFEIVFNIFMHKAHLKFF